MLLKLRLRELTEVTADVTGNKIADKTTLAGKPKNKGK